MIDRLFDTRPTRRQLLGGLLAGGCSILAGCNWDGHVNLFGYTTRPNYDENIKTVYVPTFRSKVFQTTPYRGIEFELTRAVIRDLEAVAGFKIQSDCSKADTELLGTVVVLNKNMLNRHQQNEVREGDLVLGVELVWRDLRTGQVLSNPRKPEGLVLPAELPAFDPDNAPRLPAPDAPIPALVILTGRYFPEVGPTNATAQQAVCNHLAAKIVTMMEKDWQLAPRICP